MSTALVFLAFGILYLVRPNILQTWIRARISRGTPLLPVEANEIYMRIVGVACLVLAVWCW